MYKSGVCYIRNVSMICNMLDINSANTAGYAFVTSISDYNSSLLYGLPKNQIKYRNYLVLNVVAWVVINTQISSNLFLHNIPLNWILKNKIFLSKFTFFWRILFLWSHKEPWYIFWYDQMWHPVFVDTSQAYLWHNSIHGTTVILHKLHC